jgi:hypothetical protein
MRPILFARAVAVVTALLAASFISLPSFPSTGLFTVSPPIVDRTLKGDRLPLPFSAQRIGAPIVPTQQTREKVPVGCDGAFSPVSSPRLANIFRRCTV